MVPPKPQLATSTPPRPIPAVSKSAYKNSLPDIDWSVPGELPKDAGEISYEAELKADQNREAEIKQKLNARAKELEAKREAGLKKLLQSNPRIVSGKHGCSAANPIGRALAAITPAEGTPIPDFNPSDLA